jgi:hypothetical protein
VKTWLLNQAVGRDGAGLALAVDELELWVVGVMGRALALEQARFVAEDRALGALGLSHKAPRLDGEPDAEHRAGGSQGDGDVTDQSDHDEDNGIIGAAWARPRSLSSESAAVSRQRRWRHGLFSRKRPLRIERLSWRGRRTSSNVDRLAFSWILSLYDQFSERGNIHRGPYAMKHAMAIGTDYRKIAKLNDRFAVE